MKLGVFITTHLEENIRHGGRLNQSLPTYFKYMLDNYENLPHGLTNGEVQVTLVDTGSTMGEYFEIVNEKLKNPLFKKIDIVNKGGYTAAIKHVMHTDLSLLDQFEYFLFHIDDGVEIVESNWGKDLIDAYNNIPNLGIMGRLLDTIRLGPTGLVDHRNCCSHIARIHNITQVTTIPHLHGDWWFLNKETLKALAKVWFDPISSSFDMEYFKKLEDTDYKELFRQQNDIGGWPLDDMHIGREVDTSLRIKLINKDLATYPGTVIQAKQLHHR